MIGWTCWMMVPLAAIGYGSQGKNAIRWLNGMHGVGSTNQGHVINQPHHETAASHTGSDGYKVICKHQWNDTSLQAAYIYGQGLYYVIIVVIIGYLTTRNVHLLGSGLFGYPMVDIVVGYSRELLVIWCLVEVYKVTAMIVESCQPWGRVFISFGGGNLSCISGGWLLYQATGDFSEDCQPLHVSYEWTVSATRNSIHIVGVISSFILSSGASRYR
ncbi:hypothetical protein O0I10_009999 [Lichtheimia ornata]|uniref:Uncharacterized protein n=1 Tax=Lichtheimia ornata TaxID=688661 RepID=A0AAD7UVE5_9FUNG|nr:uncharacterized protein O0I10_009999 [Lichtheimia ornata]KAJ8654303.1 hypothetical protein O0I10_009999 [Lichtheimia ornata]